MHDKMIAAVRAAVKQHESKLKAKWNDVFEPHPTKQEMLAKREGLLKPDPAYEICMYLKMVDGYTFQTLTPEIVAQARAQE